MVGHLLMQSRALATKHQRAGLGVFHLVEVELEPQVDDRNVSATVLVCDSSGGDGPFETPAVLLAKIGGGCDSQSFLFPKVAKVT